MRTGRRKLSSPTASRDLLALWGGLLALFIAVGVFVARTNECAAQDIAQHPSYNSFPGLNMDVFAPPVRQTLATRLNGRYCTCGCLMTIASCLNNHASCRTSRRAGLEMLQSAHDEFQPAHGHP
jgi:hypothetical protein